MRTPLVSMWCGLERTFGCRIWGHNDRWGISYLVDGRIVAGIRCINPLFHREYHPFFWRHKTWHSLWIPGWKQPLVCGLRQSMWWCCNLQLIVADSKYPFSFRWFQFLQRGNEQVWDFLQMLTPHQEQYLTVIQEQLREPRNVICSNVGDKIMITTIVVKRWANVPCIGTFAAPWSTGVRRFVNYSFATRWGQWELIPIVRPLYCFVSLLGGVCTQWTEHVERVFDLWGKLILQLERKSAIGGGKHTYEVCLECLNGALGGIKQWLSGSTNCKWHCLGARKLLITLPSWLSVMFRWILYPIDSRCWKSLKSIGLLAIWLPNTLMEDLWDVGSDKIYGKFVSRY